MDDINYNTQEREGNLNFDYHTHGVDLEGRPSNAMQTQTLIMPYSERPGSQTLQNNNEDLDGQRSSPAHDHSLNDDNEVDHRFMSEENEQNRKENEEDKDDEESKVKNSN